MSVCSSQSLEIYLSETKVCPIVDFNKDADRLLVLDFTAANKDLTKEILNDVNAFSTWVKQSIESRHCRYGIGGYTEHRTIYSVSPHFDAGEEPRRLHLGVDIWSGAGTVIYAPLASTVHSFAFNDNRGDYGATIILKHDLANCTFYTLYGHLSLKSLDGLTEGQVFAARDKLATLGPPAENGGWPPHLHFQLISDIGNYHGDYPGVCRFSEKEMWLKNSPDPQMILKYTFN
ncbi:peptidoglycan DD-metalloendopeptidase family protein [Pedobacter sp. HMF7647]|uniref:Peptidoglycan DD-metalloendopeptidase family protein n=1 Tax=Hufsiella arboris TaxID=2695275 RepID=A0A7K1Y5S2_9SPHI|nr:peptidoglycan DD-metalloendopeptidase family protein [Hufsiella arboris]MXV49926.1 peptidoglycan DD-metalloendopeptidase family protein [Hufsiella arboris]